MLGRDNRHKIKKVKINGTWQNAEMTRKTRELMQKLKITPIT